MSEKKKKAVILLPTFNEKNNLERFIGEVFEQEKNALGWSFELLIVDSHSTDGTEQLAEELVNKNPKIHLLEVGRGLGVGLIEGHRYSLKNLQPEAMVQMDADGQVGANVLPRMLKVLDEGYDLAIGSRYVEGGRNDLSLIRKLFSMGSCTYLRLVMGPLDIGEFTNSARAFTPELFKKIDIDRIPWKEQTFIIQPAFLNEAVRAGAKYKEVPLIFKNRAEGYSKNKTINYTYDVITYGIDARLRKLGLNLPFFQTTRKAKTILKFSLVGVLGTLVDFFFYKLFINHFNIPPATAKGFSTAIAIMNNFLLNNYWTFRNRKVETKLYERLGIFYVVSAGGLLIAVLMIKLLHSMYGDGAAVLLGHKIAYNNFYFFATIPFVLVWNFTANHFITFKKKKVN